MPPLTDFPGFTREACTVWAVTQRELRPDPADYSLLMMERMWMVDTMNSLAIGTHKAYQGKLNYLRAFEKQKGLEGQVLPTTPVDAPPALALIPLMWAQQQYSLQMSRWKKKITMDDEARVSFASSRDLRSAASLHHKIDLQAAYPGRVYVDSSKRIVVGHDVSPTDELGYTMMNSGMSARIGTKAKPPSIALLDRHIRYLDTSLERRFREAQWTQR